MKFVKLLLSLVVFLIVMVEVTLRFLFVVFIGIPYLMLRKMKARVWLFFMKRKHPELYNLAMATYDLKQAMIEEGLITE